MIGSLTLPDWNRLPAEDAAVALRACCASGRWLQELVNGRPYATADRLIAASDAALRALAWPDVEQALAAHPRIGDRPAGADRESAWSREEQSGAVAEHSSAAELRENNVAYEARFGHVFLICATGRSAAEILTELRRRLGNVPAAEQSEVRTELRDIVELRLRKAIEEDAAR